MTRIVQVIETIFAENIACWRKRYYAFHLPWVGEPGFYRQTVSFNAFFHSLSCRNWTTKRLFVARCLWSERGDAEAEDIIECRDIWEFYQKIGYDHRSKRYLTGEIIPQRKFE